MELLEKGTTKDLPPARLLRSEVPAAASYGGTQEPKVIKKVASTAIKKPQN